MMNRLGDFLIRLSKADRRYVFLALTVAVLLPFFAPVSFTAKPSEETLRFESALNNVISKPGPIMLCVDFGPQTMAEMAPILKAVMHKLFHEKKQVVFLTFLPDAAAPIRQYLSEMEKIYNLEYGKDYVFLGYASAYTMAINELGTSIENYFHYDDKGTPLSDIPLMEGIKSVNEMAAVIDIASNTMPRYWITFGVAPFGFDFLMACTAVQATDYFPYIQAGQVKGLIAGGRAGAEYEGILLGQNIIKKPGDATRGLGSQSMALMAIIFFIIIGNIGYFIERRRTKNKENM